MRMLILKIMAVTTAGEIDDDDAEDLTGNDDCGSDTRDGDADTVDRKTGKPMTEAAERCSLWSS